MIIRLLRALLAKASGIEALERRLAAVELQNGRLGRNVHELAAAGLKQNRVLAGLLEDADLDRRAAAARLH